MSVIGKKPYINTIIDELLEDKEGNGEEVLVDLSYLVNEAGGEEPTPLDFTNPLEEIYNYEEFGNACSLTHTTIKLSEGLVVTGFLVITLNHNALFTFDESGENMECYDLVWTEYERSYTPVNESLDANEFRREIALQGGSGGGGAKPLIIEVEGTANTSTLPTIVVPAMTPTQVLEAYHAIQEGKTVIVSTEDGAKFFVDEANSNNPPLESNVSIRFVYYNAYLEYTYNMVSRPPFAESVTYEYTGLGGGGTSLYYHEIKMTIGGTQYWVNVLSTDGVSKKNITFTNAFSAKTFINIMVIQPVNKMPDRCYIGGYDNVLNKKFICLLYSDKSIVEMDVSGIAITADTVSEL